jgi:hypothetical protein
MPGPGRPRRFGRSDRRRSVPVGSASQRPNQEHSRQKQANITIRFLESIDATLIEPLNIRSTCAPVAEESPTVPAPIQESAGDSFPTPPSPDLPYDADVAKARKLDDEGKIPVAQQEFDILAWQAFIVALPDLPADD